MSICIAERGLPERLSLSKPRMSFCNPRIIGKFFRGGRIRDSEEGGRLNDICRRTSSGRAVGWIYMY